MKKIQKNVGKEWKYQRDRKSELQAKLADKSYIEVPGGFASDSHFDVKGNTPGAIDRGHLQDWKNMISWTGRWRLSAFNAAFETSVPGMVEIDAGMRRFETRYRGQPREKSPINLKLMGRLQCYYDLTDLCYTVFPNSMDHNLDRCDLSNFMLGTFVRPNMWNCCTTTEVRGIQMMLEVGGLKWNETAGTAALIFTILSKFVLQAPSERFEQPCQQLHLSPSTGYRTAVVDRSPFISFRSLHTISVSPFRAVGRFNIALSLWRPWRSGIFLPIFLTCIFSSDPSSAQHMESFQLRYCLPLKVSSERTANVCKRSCHLTRELEPMIFTLWLFLNVPFICTTPVRCSSFMHQTTRHMLAHTLRRNKIQFRIEVCISSALLKYRSWVYRIIPFSRSPYQIQFHTVDHSPDKPLNSLERGGSGPDGALLTAIAHPAHPHLWTLPSLHNRLDYGNVDFMLRFSGVQLNDYELPLFDEETSNFSSTVQFAEKKPIRSFVGRFLFALLAIALVVLFEFLLCFHSSKPAIPQFPPGELNHHVDDQIHLAFLKLPTKKEFIPRMCDNLDWRMQSGHWKTWVILGIRPSLPASDSSRDSLPGGTGNNSNSLWERFPFRCSVPCGPSIEATSYFVVADDNGGRLLSISWLTFSLLGISAKCSRQNLLREHADIFVNILSIGSYPHKYLFHNSRVRQGILTIRSHNYGCTLRAGRWLFGSIPEPVTHMRNSLHLQFSNFEPSIRQTLSSEPNSPTLPPLARGIHLSNILPISIPNSIPMVDSNLYSFVVVRVVWLMTYQAFLFL
ncbi:uncharacterized protein BDR25DRAFT_354606 [Lindgomyces ingoldianus]|uniref:Uncharacterized protein n=1 Tax=Lindgomyces ingoldianus TaxID=673940 RepID=A0ACB6QWS8_9PLEO|nr:uncharacterized protein BDR25DRAFT_354606 [Lindgomyces ingoldianus]KAF2471361.1 hypothetical protein BDR25DRAFT_354606 [Lindgomyces ingoldianus]